MPSVNEALVRWPSPQQQHHHLKQRNSQDIWIPKLHVYTVFYLILLVGSTSAFCLQEATVVSHSHPLSRSACRLGTPPSSFFSLKATNGESKNDDEYENLLATSSSRLSHVMLQVPSVDDTVAYWKETANAQVTASSKLDQETDNTKDTLRSAFVVLGNGKTTEDCFALEIVRTRQKSFQLGNAVSYLGVSKLVQYASPQDLIAVIAGNDKDEAQLIDDADEPNGIPVQSCASAPGDYLARLCLHTADMQATTDFYTDILGMTVAAADDDGKMLCLRYKGGEDSSDNNKQFYGVPTTLVFEPASELDKGNCLDHFVIATKADMDDLYQQLQQIMMEKDTENAGKLFMKPTEMFGKVVLGVMDPNGHKVILAGEKKA
ncbi:expressed unknown protein [Seminavis robusta]|uniref:VOC domain-containing protein n=1 Tax=Seminavis robusta TaxID=568900 RepID=A0A9N8DAL3_9STRA|nr:expressed unknown protein [Seminavis robusta]|eukprot:Sro17_g012150.1 n/a (376) ;mRNA; r:41861-42988